MTSHRKPVGVKISPHAVERFHQRFPEVPEDTIRGLIYKEVQQALAAGRRSSSLPKWVHRGSKSNGRHERERFVWNEERTRCYPIMEDYERGHERRDEFGLTWIVKTTMASLSEEERAEAERLRKIVREKRGAKNRVRRPGTVNRPFKPDYEVYGEPDYDLARDLHRGK